MNETSERKTHPASSQKLRKLREDGTVPQGAEVSAYLGQFSVFLYFSLAGKFIYESIKTGIYWSFNQISLPFDLVLENAMHNGFLLFVHLAGPVVLVLTSAIFIVTLIYHKGLIFSTKRISPKLESISPAKGLSQIFGMRGLVEFGISISRLILWTLTFFSIMWFWFDDLVKSPVCGIPCTFQISLLILIKILSAVLVLYVVFVVVEVLVQKFLFSNDQRMTKSEVKKEQRDQHGTPEVRSARRRFRNDLEASVDAIGVHKATMAFFWNDKVVAIRYIPDVAPVPILSAKGVALLESTRIRTIVRENGRREIEDESFVLAMISKKPGETVPLELYDQLRNLIHIMYRT